MSTTKKQIGYGSQGDEVKELQTTLNNNGYKLDVDGIFGAKTLSAVKDYQKQNSLSVDGIVGKNTWGALLSSGNETNRNNMVMNANDNATRVNYSNNNTSTPSTKASTPTTKTTADGYKYNDYSESDVVANAYAALEAQKQQKPGEYKSQWQQGLDEAMKKILNREKFSYNLSMSMRYNNLW